MQSVPITINVLSLHPAHGAMYSIPDYVIKFVSDLQQVSDFSPGSDTPVSSTLAIFKSERVIAVLTPSEQSFSNLMTRTSYCDDLMMSARPSHIIGLI
jgi:hypothetical protein